MLLIPALLLCAGCLSDMTVPGLYMDAVNPDYMVIRVLNPATEVQSLHLPGTMLFDRFPVIGQLYHGALPFYLGLPVYALLGTGILGVRSANCVFALLVLAACGCLLRSFRVRGATACLLLSGLALDPGFLFNFRTQFYITLLPSACLFTSIGLVESTPGTPSRLKAVLAGLLAGLSVYGYFIYLFLLPVAALHAAWHWRQPRRLAWGWLAGVAVGGSPYLLALLLILAATGSWQDLVAFLHGNLATLAVAPAPLKLIDRLQLIASMVRMTLLDVGPSAMMLHEAVPLALPQLKIALLLGVPALGLAASLVRRPRSPGLAVMAGLLCGMAVLIAAFTTRLWLHHTAVLLPVLYMALALAIGRLCHGFGRVGAGLAVFAVGAPLLIGNALDRQVVFFDLERTGGIGLFSDAIDRFAQDARQATTPTHAFFPDWGVFMPFAMRTARALK